LIYVYNSCTVSMRGVIFMPNGVQNPHNWRHNYTQVEDPDCPGRFMWVTSQVCICHNCGKMAKLEGVSYLAPPPEGKEHEKVHPTRIYKDQTTQLRYPKGWIQLGVHPTVKERETIIDLIDIQKLPAGIAFEMYDDYASQHLFVWACGYKCARKTFMKLLRRAYGLDKVERTVTGWYEWLKLSLQKTSGLRPAS